MPYCKIQQYTTFDITAPPWYEAGRGSKDRYTQTSICGITIPIFLASTGSHLLEVPDT
jgi:hypothetical protein